MAPVCANARRLESLAREWINLDDWVKATCPDYWMYAQEEGAGSSKMRRFNETNTQMVVLCTGFGL